MAASVVVARNNCHIVAYGREETHVKDNIVWGQRGSTQLVHKRVNVECQSVVSSDPGVIAVEILST
jgi:hypothetical protein